MPIGQYIAWVGSLLVALLFVADWCLPKSVPEPAADAVSRPIIRIASIQQPSERVFIDTNQPIIIPPPTIVAEIPTEPSHLQSYASAAPPPMAADVDQKRRKLIKPHAAKVAAKPPPSTTAVARGSSATTVPLTKLSLADIISGRLMKNLFNLH